MNTIELIYNGYLSLVEGSKTFPNSRRAAWGFLSLSTMFVLGPVVTLVLELLNHFGVALFDFERIIQAVGALGIVFLSDIKGEHSWFGATERTMNESESGQARAYAYTYSISSVVFFLVVNIAIFADFS